jgi:hypothetical protein
MGYDYVIRVTVDSDSDLTAELLLSAYEKFKKYGDAEFFFGSEGHGSASWLSCGGLNEYVDKLIVFTQEFPTKTFTFYNHFFDYFAFEKIVIKNKERISNTSFSNFDTNEDETILKSILECEKNGIIFKNKKKLSSVHLPTNIILNELEISGLFSCEDDSMSGGFCFGPTCENVNGYLKKIYINKYKGNENMKCLDITKKENKKLEKENKKLEKEKNKLEEKIKKLIAEIEKNKKQE